MKYRLTKKGRYIIAGFIVVLLALLIYGAFVLGTYQGTSKKIVEKAKVSESKIAIDAPKVTFVNGVPTNFVNRDIKSVFFLPDDATITQAGKKNIMEAYEFLKSQEGSIIVLEGFYNGYPDLEGSYYEELSARRADAVAAMLEGLGCPKEKIHKYNRGKSKQFNNGNSETELSKNRRVDMSIYVLNK